MFFMVCMFLVLIAIFAVVMIGLYFLVKMVELDLEKMDDEDDR